ncbi:MAG TPA: DUF4825 domain-containing protein [Clostridiaceae bacterium]
MKTRNRIIICLIVIGTSLLILVQGIIIPKNNQEKKQYIIEQQEPTTHDLESILKYKSKYMGNFSNMVNLFHTLPLNNKPRTFELFSDNTMDVNYKENIENISGDKLSKALIYNSTAAFALIDNLQGINYNFTDGKYIVQRSDIEKWYGEDLLKLLTKDEWKSKVQVKLEDEEYIKSASEVLLIKD